jgi:hypothetical protein
MQPITLHTKFGEQHASVVVTPVALESDYISVHVATLQDALLAAYCYRKSGEVKIEESPNIVGYVIVVYYNKA